MLSGLFLFGDFLAAALLVAATNWIALIPFRRAREQHWTERARKLHPARAGAIVGIWLLPTNLVLMQHVLWPDNAPPWTLAAFVSCVGAMLATCLFDRQVFPWLSWKDLLHQAASAWVLR